MRLANERYEEQLRLCDQELRKMLIDCQHLKDEEHSRADFYFDKINGLQNKHFGFKSNMLNEFSYLATLASSSVPSVNVNETNLVINELDVKSTNFQLKNYLQWIDQKTVNLKLKKIFSII